MNNPEYIKNLCGHNVRIVSNGDSDALLEASIGTNGFKGGDYGHGGRHYLSLCDFFELLDMRVRIRFRDGEVVQYEEEVKEIEIFLSGDWELHGLLKAVEHFHKTLKEQAGEN